MVEDPPNESADILTFAGSQPTHAWQVCTHPIVSKPGSKQTQIKSDGVVTCTLAAQQRKPSNSHTSARCQSQESGPATSDGTNLPAARSFDSLIGTSSSKRVLIVFLSLVLGCLASRRSTRGSDNDKTKQYKAEISLLFAAAPRVRQAQQQQQQQQTSKSLNKHDGRHPDAAHAVELPALVVHELRDGVAAEDVALGLGFVNVPRAAELCQQRSPGRVAPQVSFPTAQQEHQHSRKRKQPIGSSHNPLQQQRPAYSFPSSSRQQQTHSTSPSSSTSSSIGSSLSRVHTTSGMHQWQQQIQQSRTGNNNSFSKTANNHNTTSHYPRLMVTHPPPVVQRERTSRYLSEGDRRAIIRRIERGEKQVALAKEYRVSRAAICNLYKNRKEVLTRVDRDPDAKHPKKHKPKPLAASPEASLSPPTSPVVPSVDEEQEDEDEEEHGLRHQHQQQIKRSLSNRSDSMETEVVRQRSPSHSPEPQIDRPAAPPKPFHVHDASMHSLPIKNLLRTLRSGDTESPTFRHTADRLMRMLIEESLAYVQHSQDDDVDVKMGSPSRDSCPRPVSATIDECDICAITMEEVNRATPVLLRALTNVLPLASTGAITLVKEDAHSRSPSTSHGRSWCIRAQVPERIDSHQAVLLLDLFCGTGERACSVLQYLVHEKRVAPSRIYFVTVNGSVSGLQYVHRYFPDVGLITAQMDANDDEQHRLSAQDTCSAPFPERSWNHQPYDGAPPPPPHRHQPSH
ncbi:Uracil phosphoribosyltransferase, partial [Globisporangium splendens]